jgi:hypothetical protein
MASWQRSSLVGLDAVVIEFEDSRSGLIDETSLAISQGTSLSEASLVMVNSGATKETVSISPSHHGGGVSGDSKLGSDAAYPSLLQSFVVQFLGLCEKSVVEGWTPRVRSRGMNSSHCR